MFTGSIDTEKLERIRDALDDIGFNLTSQELSLPDGTKTLSYRTDNGIRSYTLQTVDTDELRMFQFRSDDGCFINVDLRSYTTRLYSANAQNECIIEKAKGTPEVAVYGEEQKLRENTIDSLRRDGRQVEEAPDNMLRVSYGKHGEWIQGHLMCTFYKPHGELSYCIQGVPFHIDAGDIVSRGDGMLKDVTLHKPVEFNCFLHGMFHDGEGEPTVSEDRMIGFPLNKVTEFDHALMERYDLRRK